MRRCRPRPLLHHPTATPSYTYQGRGHFAGCIHHTVMDLTGKEVGEEKSVIHSNEQGSKGAPVGTRTLRAGVWAKRLTVVSC
jgi:hypothetical protein